MARQTRGIPRSSCKVAKCCCDGGGNSLGTEFIYSAPRPAAMGDLEEAFLKSNVPGRYSAWADDDGGDNDDAGNGHSAAVVGGGEGPPAALNRLEAPASRNTGAKGVLADHRAAKEEEAYRREIEKRETEAVLNRAVRGATMGPGQVSLSQAAAEERRRAERIRTREAERGDTSSNSDTDGNGDGDSSDDDDDEFMRSYRQKRLLELQNAASFAPASASASASTAANTSTSRPHYYSEVQDVTPIQYAEAVDETDPDTLLVVHLYEPHIPACADVNNHLDTLAQSHTCGSGSRSVRFLRLRATEAKSDMDLVGLPSLLVYRGGQLVHNWTPVTQHLPPRFTAEDLQTLLFDSCGLATTTASSAAASASTEIDRGDSYDSDDSELDEYCAGFGG